MNKQQTAAVPDLNIAYTIGLMQNDLIVEIMKNQAFRMPST